MRSGPWMQKILDAAPPGLGPLPAYLQGLKDAELAAAWEALIMSAIVDESLDGGDLELGLLARALNEVALRTRTWQRRVYRPAEKLKSKK